MAGERNFLRVPPDSTGKRVKMKHTAQVFYDGKSTGAAPNYVWSIGEFYTIAGFGLVHIHGAQELTNDTGILEVHYNKSAVYNGTNPSVGANIISDDGSTIIAQVSSFNDIYINSNHIVGYDNPEYGVDVDATGSLNVRFAEGLPQLDAFGRLRVSGKTILGDYIFANNQLPSEFSTVVWGRGAGVPSASLSHDDLRHCITLETPALTSTSIGDNSQYYVEHTTNTYHHYFPGSSHLAMMTVAASNSGEAGVMKEWGYFDDEAGYFFRINEEQISEAGDNFEFVIRTSTDGNLRETRMGRNYTNKYLWNSGTETWDSTSTSTNGWNGDPLDGQGDSGRTIDLTDDTIWWIDIQWLGAGRVRFGTYVQGQRVVVHSYYHDTNDGYPSAQVGALPLSFRQYNIKNATVSNATQLRVWCATVATESNIDVKGLGVAKLETFTATFDPDNLNDWKGTNDIGKGDGSSPLIANRVGVTTTGVTGSTTTLTVPSSTIVGPGNIIRPGYRLHMVNNNAGGSLVMGTEVVEIVNSTTIIVSQAPSSALTGVEEIRFHMHVSNEYNLIGILSPRKILRGQNHLNRTLYTAQSMEAMAYHENGDPAFVEIEVYVQPVLSGNESAINLLDTDTPTPGPFSSIEPDDPTTAVVSYKDNGMVNFFGGGYHQLATYFKGNAARVELGAAYGNMSSGAFKLKAAGGGNNRCPILRTFQSPAAGIPTVIEIDTATVFANGGPSFSLHREGNPIEFENIEGLIGSDATYGLNKSANNNGPYYLRMITKSHAELYTDIGLQNPVDTSALSTATNGNSLTWERSSVPAGGFILSGSGEDLYFAIVAKPVGPSIANGVNTYGSTTSNTLNRDITVHFILTWNEISQ
jgi:hypothetical protein